MNAVEYPNKKAARPLVRRLASLLAVTSAPTHTPCGKHTDMPTGHAAPCPCECTGWPGGVRQAPPAKRVATPHVRLATESLQNQRATRSAMAIPIAHRAAFRPSSRSPQSQGFARTCSQRPNQEALQERARSDQIQKRYKNMLAATNQETSQRMIGHRRKPQGKRVRPGRHCPDEPVKIL